MAAPLPESPTETRTLSPEEKRAFFDEQCRAVLGISGKEFIRRWDSGEYADLDDVPENWDIFEKSLLLAFGRQ